LILIAIGKATSTLSDITIILLEIPIESKYGFPSKLLSTEDGVSYEFINDISGMYIKNNKRVDALSEA